MTWGELKAECERRLAAGGVDRPARLVLDWFDDVFGRASRRADEAVPSPNVAQTEAQLSRLLRGEPLAYVTGVAHFYGYELEIAEGVLIPRPETEELVRWIEETHALRPALRFADLCTGSGCIAVALARRRPTWSGVAVDISPYAVDIARRNVGKHDLRALVSVVHTDLFDPRATDVIGPCDLIASNPPYIPDADWGRVGPEVADYEPHLALRVPDAEPLKFYERTVEIARKALAPGGWLYFECNDRYANAVSELLRDGGYSSVGMLIDMQGRPRHVRAQKADSAVANS